MAGRKEFDGERQKAVLAKLQHRAGLDGTAAAVRVGFSYPQALRYFNGKTPLRPDQYETFARAYGISAVDLAAELSGVDVFPDLRDVAPADHADGWTFRGALRGQIPEYLIDQLAETWEGRPLINQKSAAEGILEMAAEMRTDSMPSRESHAG